MKKHLLLYLKGMAMGAADVVPGVSGGTVAFISGIYEQLLDALSSMPQALLLLLKGQIKPAWQQAQGTFLLVLFAGIATSILTLARVITWLLATHPIPVWGFFFGLIAVSSALMIRDIRRWQLPTYVALVLGTVLAWFITVAAPIQWGVDAVSLFFAGAIAICAMILPGISGSFLLLLMGLYTYILTAVKNLELGIMLVFAAGCVCGLLGFAKVLKAALQRYHDVTLALLTGVMLGSLNKIWPWKQTLLFYTDRHGEQAPLQQTNVLPWQYAQFTGEDARLLVAILLAVAGIALVLLLDGYARRQVAPSK